MQQNGMNHTDVTILPFEGKTPKIHDSAFIAPGSRIIGDVEIGAGSSIWYNCVLRGDINRIVIGERSNLQDGTVVHVEGPRPDTDGKPTIIGDDVLVGHMVMLHGCVLEDRAFVGMSSIIMDGCRICSDGMLAAGAMLTPGKVIPSAELWAGRPAKLMRGLSEEQVAGLTRGAKGYVLNAQRHRAALDAL